MKYYLPILFMVLLILSGCGGKVPTANPATLRIMTHDSFEVSQEVVTAFEQANQVHLVFLKSGDAGAALNKAILSKETPLADVFYGVDNTFLSRAVEAGIFDPYVSSGLKNIPEEYLLDPGDQLLPVDYADVCLNYDRAYFSSHKQLVPQTFEDLLKPEYKGFLVVENPASSSPGLAFLLATISHFGENGYLDYWQSLKTNGLVVVEDWSTAYYTNFSGSSGRGPQPLVVSYASSPAAEVVYAEKKITDAPTASITSAGTCFRQVEFVGILKGTQNRILAEKWIDFMLGVQFQQDMPLQMFVYPVNPQAALPSEFIQYARVSDQPASISPEIIALNRDHWISDWVDIVLH